MRISITIDAKTSSTRDRFDTWITTESGKSIHYSSATANQIGDYTAALLNALNEAKPDKKHCNSEEYLLIASRNTEVAIRKYEKLSDAIKVMQKEFYDSVQKDADTSLGVDSAHVITSNKIRHWKIVRKSSITEGTHECG